MIQVPTTQGCRDLSQPEMLPGDCSPSFAPPLCCSRTGGQEQRSRGQRRSRFLVGRPPRDELPECGAKPRAQTSSGHLGKGHHGECPWRCHGKNLVQMKRDELMQDVACDRHDCWLPSSQSLADCHAERVDVRAFGDQPCALNGWVCQPRSAHCVGHLSSENPTKGDTGRLCGICLARRGSKCEAVIYPNWGPKRQRKQRILHPGSKAQEILNITIGRILTLCGLLGPLN